MASTCCLVSPQLNEERSNREEVYLYLLGDNNNEGYEDAMLLPTRHTSEVDLHEVSKQVGYRPAHIAG